MKRLLLFITLLQCTINISAQLKCEVNECFELTSIVFRLAGAPEYINDEILNYTNEIDNHFSKHIEHKLILFLKEIREKYGISYDAVTSAAACLDIVKGKVTIKQDIDISKINEIDERWSTNTFRMFLEYLNDFYQVTKFKSFYSKHDYLYNIAIERMEELVAEINTDWFESFFGVKLQEIYVIVSLCNGSHNYAFSTSETNKNNGITIGCIADENGLPTFDRNMIFIVVHELLHHYTNSIISNYWNQIDEASLEIYSYIEEDMHKLAYGNARTAMIEWLTNLFSIIYIQKNPNPNLSVDYIIRQFHHQGFIWMERSVMFMKHFCNNREQYITIEDYNSQLIGFINYTANVFDQIWNEYNNRRPYVTEAFPMPGSTITFAIDSIKIRFSEPMLDAHGLTSMEKENISDLPFRQMPSWKDEYTYIIPLDKNKLEDGKTYGMKLNSQFFQSEKTYSMNEDYIYIFNINKK